MCQLDTAFFCKVNLVNSVECVESISKGLAIVQVLKKGVRS
jgi:hypothetical protein